MERDVMPRQIYCSAIPLALMILSATGCQRAERYPAAKLVEPATGGDAAGKPTEALVRYAWLPPNPPRDIPIRFVTSDSPEWAKLPGFWSITPHPVAWQQTLHLGQSQLGSLAALVLAEQLDIAITIKVPLGLPVPTYPRANPPTYLKWALGKRLFFDPNWLVQGKKVACATCHNPKEGFTERRQQPVGAARNAPSLINCAYNHSQFWDGRVQELEQVVQRDLSDEEPLPEPVPPERAPAYRHAFNRVVHRLDKDDAYRSRFMKVFGTPPTQDNLAKALATYLRTILAGNSLYDQARKAASQRGVTEPAAEDFERLLDASAVAALRGGLKKPAEAAAVLVEGQRLFHGRAGCVRCHPAPLFTDHDFHNVGVGESDSLDNTAKAGREKGHFAFVPLGLKETRLIGAFRTPSLRILPQTAPYFHDGSSGLLDGVVDYFNKGLDFQPFLDPALLESPSVVRKLNLDGNQVRALAVFLRALDGDPVPAVIAAPPARADER
jgi:cytochrome c peroxidase